MPPGKSQSEGPEKAQPFNAVDFAAAARRCEEFANVQAEVFGRFQEANKRWLDLMQGEANLASEFAPKLLSAGSIYDVIAVYQQWGAGLFSIMTKHIREDMDKFILAGLQTLANGPALKGPGIST